MTDRSISQIKRGARAKGLNFQSATARELRPWFPEARSERNNGFRSATHVAADAGDLGGAGDRLFWSLKNVEAATALPSGTILGWLNEAREKGRGRIPLLVIKRKGHTSPLRSWCWWWLSDLHCAMTGECYAERPPHDDVPVMMELQHALQVLVEAGLTDTIPEVA